MAEMWGSDQQRGNAEGGAVTGSRGCESKLQITSKGLRHCPPVGRCPQGTQSEPSTRYSELANLVAKLRLWAQAQGMKN